MPAHTNPFSLAVRSIDDPLYPASQQLFAPSFDPQQAARTLAPRQEAVIAYCFDILDMEELNGIDAPGGGYAPANAALLLAEWKVQAALPRLWRLVENADCHGALLDEVLCALWDWGYAVVDALFPFTQTTPDHCRLLLGSILSCNGRRNPRVRDWLLTQLEVPQSDDEIFGFAGCLLEVDSMRAIPHLVTHILDDNQYSNDLRQRVCAYMREYLLDHVLF